MQEWTYRIKQTGLGCYPQRQLPWWLGGFWVSVFPYTHPMSMKAAEEVISRSRAKRAKKQEPTEYRYDA